MHTSGRISSPNTLNGTVNINICKEVCGQTKAYLYMGNSKKLFKCESIFTHHYLYHC